MGCVTDLVDCSYFRHRKSATFLPVPVAALQFAETFVPLRYSFVDGRLTSNH